MTSHLTQQMKNTTYRFVIAGLVLLVAAIGLSVVWNRSIKNELAAQASSFVRKGIISTEMRGVVEYLNGVQFSAFESVSLFRADGEHIITLPPTMDRKEREASFWRELLFGTIKADIFLDSDKRDLAARATFVYSRFELAPYMAVFWVFAVFGLALLLRQAKVKVEVEFAKELRLKRSEFTEEVAKKVRHNIRSPLAVLRAIFIDLSVDAEEFFPQGRNAVLRLEEIVSEMKSENQGKAAPKSIRPAIYEIVSSMKSIVAEKRLIFGEVEISLEIRSDEKAMYSEIPSSEFRAMLSNLLQNSRQAIKGQGEIKIRVEADQYAISIEIEDSGCGIPKELRTEVFGKHVTHGDHNGSGLGLYYAKKLIDDYSGNIEIAERSAGRFGTQLNLMLPKSETPCWHIDQLNLSGELEVAVCDDQSGIIESWRNRFKSLERSPQALFFGSCEQMVSQLDLHTRRTYLVDYDLGQSNMSGLDFFKLFKSPQNLVLVTGHFDEPGIQESCAEIGCKLLSKDAIFQIEII